MSRPEDHLTDPGVSSPTDAAQDEPVTDSSEAASHMQSQPADGAPAPPDRTLAEALDQMAALAATLAEAEDEQSGEPERADNATPQVPIPGETAEPAQASDPGPEPLAPATGEIETQRDLPAENEGSPGSLAESTEEPRGESQPLGEPSPPAPTPDAVAAPAPMSEPRVGPLSVAPPKPTQPISSRPPPESVVAGTSAEVNRPPPSPVPPAPTAEWSRVSEASSVSLPDFRASKHRSLRWVAVLAVVGALVALIVVMAWPRQGLLTVTALVPGGQTLGQVEVSVDGRIRCQGAPCAVSDLASGEHTVRVASTEHGTAERVVAMRTGIDHSIDVLLASQTPAATAPRASAEALPRASAEASDRVAVDRARTTPAGRGALPPGPSTGTIKANSLPVSKVLVDGRVAGQTPANIQVAPGTHTVSFVHAEYGRKDVVVDVKARQDAVVAVKFHPGEH
jgi:hypothetical protein